MLKKIALSLFLMVAGSLTASAQEFEYVGVQGSWWNPDFAGEGFAIEEYGDGFVIAYWYTYNEDGQQMWLIGTGQKQGNSVELDMYRTDGGILASTESSGSLTETLWGNVTLDVIDCSSISMSYQSDDGNLSGGYQVERLRDNPFAVGSCDAIESEGDNPEPPPEEPPPEEPPPEEPPPEEPPPEEPPPEEPPPEEPDEIVIEMERKLVSGEWIDISVPFWGLAVINKSVPDGQDRIKLFDIRVTAARGDIVIESFSATEPTGVSQPTIQGLRAGQIIPEGTTQTFSLWSNTTGGLRVYPEFFVFVQDFGEIVNLRVRLSTQTL